MNPTIKTNKGEVMLIEVPMDARDFIIRKPKSLLNDRNNYVLAMKVDKVGYFNSVKEFPFTELNRNVGRVLVEYLLGTITNAVVDFDCENLVEHEYSSITGEWYKNHETGKMNIVSSTDSFLSLIRSNGIVLEGKKYCCLLIKS